MQSWKSAPDADAIALALLADTHDHLTPFGVRCVFCAEPEKKNGRECLATIRKVGGLNAFLALAPPMQGVQHSLDLELPAGFEAPEPFLLIVVSMSHWDGLQHWQRVALIDHELCHARVGSGPDDEPVLKIVGHDVEEFVDVVKRHGDWNHQIQPLVEAATPSPKAEAI